MLQSYKTVSCHNVSHHLDSFGLFGRSDEYGEGPKGPASTGEEAEMGFEALKVLDKSRSVTDTALIQLGMQHHRHHHCHQSPFESMRYLRLSDWCPILFHVLRVLQILQMPCWSQLNPIEAPRPPPGPPPPLVRE